MRRSELRSRSTSPSGASSDEVKDQWRRKLHLAYKDGISEQSTHDTHGPDGTPSEIPGDPNEEAYEFQLFSQKSRPSAISTPQPPKVLLRSPSPEVKEPGFVLPARSQDFYFTGAVTPEAQRRFRDVAIEGERVITESQTVWVHNLNKFPSPFMLRLHIPFSRALNFGGVSPPSRSLHTSKRDDTRIHWILRKQKRGSDPGRRGGLPSGPRHKLGKGAKRSFKSRKLRKRHFSRRNAAGGTVRRSSREEKRQEARRKMR